MASLHILATQTCSNSATLHIIHSKDIDWLLSHLTAGGAPTTAPDKKKAAATRLIRNNTQIRSAQNKIINYKGFCPLMTMLFKTKQVIWTNINVIMFNFHDQLTWYDVREGESWHVKLPPAKLPWSKTLTRPPAQSPFPATATITLY